VTMPNQSDADEVSHVFISPHFDDAVLSCGGTLHQLVKDGQTVRVMTMMAGLFNDELPHTPILEDLHQRWQIGENPLLARQREDINALQSLGVEFMHVPLTDCVYRLADDIPLYPSEESLFGEVHPNDYATRFLNEVGLPFRESPKIVYVPLGVGHHVDHQVVRDWGLCILRQKSDHVTIKFYAEYPYLNAEHSIDEALTHFSILLTSNNVILDEDDIKAKVDAIAHYKSQISTFWKSITAMEDDIKQASTHPETGDYVERFWDISQEGATE
jgi:LmbE family N-acetylglucosaminyl deacetylase